MTSYRTQPLLSTHSADPGLDYDDVPTDAPGHDDPTDGPQACHVPCDNLATHHVTTVTGRVLLLCTPHAMAHRQSVPLFCSGCHAATLDGEVCTCAADDILIDDRHMAAAANWEGRVW